MSTSQLVIVLHACQKQAWLDCLFGNLLLLCIWIQPSPTCLVSWSTCQRTTTTGRTWTRWSARACGPRLLPDRPLVNSPVTPGGVGQRLQPLQRNNYSLVLWGDGHLLPSEETALTLNHSLLFHAVPSRGGTLDWIFHSTYVDLIAHLTVYVLNTRPQACTLANLDILSSPSVLFFYLMFSSWLYIRLKLLNELFMEARNTETCALGPMCVNSTALSSNCQLETVLRWNYSSSSVHLEIHFLSKTSQQNETAEIGEGLQ